MERKDLFPTQRKELKTIFNFIERHRIFISNLWTQNLEGADELYEIYQRLDDKLQELNIRLKLYKDHKEE